VDYQQATHWIDIEGDGNDRNSRAVSGTGIADERRAEDLEA